MHVQFNNFKGMAPILLPERLPPGVAQSAQNCRFESGGIMPIKQVASVVTPAKSGTKLSIYPYETKWFHWLEDVNVCKGAVAADGFNRVYWTGEGAPKMSVSGYAISGGTQYPTNSYNLGLPRPSTVSAATSGAAGSDLSTQEQRSYVITFVTAYGEESVPSLPTADMTVDTATQTVNLTNIPVAPVGAYNVVAKNIYRSATGSSSTEFQLVTTIAIATTSYNDSIATADLGEVLPSGNYYAPNSGLKGLISLPAGFMAGFYNNVLCFSVPYQPHAWDPAYQIILPDNIIALASYGSSILVMTTGLPVLVTGSDPSGMSIEYLEKGEACVSKRGVVDLGYSIAYPGTTGLWMAGGNSIDMVTARIMTQAQWSALVPSSILGTEYERAYVGFYNTGSATGGFILDGEGNYSLTDIYATAAHLDRATGKLYLMVGNDVVEWCGGSTFYTASWRSGKVVLPKPCNLGAAQVLAQAYPLTMKVYADGVLKSTQTISNSVPVRLPSGFLASVWEMEIIGGSGIYAASMASSMMELAQA